MCTYICIYKIVRKLRLSDLKWNLKLFKNLTHYNNIDLTFYMFITPSVAQIVCYNFYSFYFYIVTNESVKYSTNIKYDVHRAVHSDIFL